LLRRSHVGHVLDKEEWVHSSIPAIAEVEASYAIAPDRTHIRKVGALLHPQREPRAVLDAMKETLGSYHFAAQYQQTPGALGRQHDPVGVVPNLPRG
jgi:hypothetical protein